MNDHLLWMDLEMSGLDPERERILEVAAIFTTGDLDPVADGPDLVIHQSPEILGAMDAWNVEHHTKSGLVAKVAASILDEVTAEDQLLAFVDAHLPANARPVLAGNSIHQDRRFIRRYLPRLDRRLHYRMVDVSTVKELVRRWYPAIAERRPAKAEAHRALDDVRESIAELRYYRDHAFVPRPAVD